MLPVAIIFGCISTITLGHPHAQTLGAAENIDIDLGSSSTYFSQKPYSPIDLSTELASTSQWSTTEDPSRLSDSEMSSNKVDISNASPECKSLNSRDLEPMTLAETLQNPSICKPLKESTADSRRRTANEARKKASAEFDPDFDCSKMDEGSDAIRNPLYRFCCTQGPPERSTRGKPRYHDVQKVNQPPVKAMPSIRRGCIVCRLHIFFPKTSLSRSEMIWRENHKFYLLICICRQPFRPKMFWS